MPELYYSRAKFLNFGDDLNVWLWPRLLPKYFASASDSLLVGTGTILNDKVPSNVTRYVVGSGVGYGRLPSDLASPDWKFIFVRGPLTSRALGIDSSRALTDGAMILPTIMKSSPSKPKGIIFIPHWKSAMHGDWEEVCAMAGVRFVSPMQPLEMVVAEMCNAELVISESMHGAIISDAYRVPWVAVQTSPEVNDFKWTDWCSSVGLQYSPVLISASGIKDTNRARIVRRKGSEEALSLKAIHNDAGSPEFDHLELALAAFTEKHKDAPPARMEFGVVKNIRTRLQSISYKARECVWDISLKKGSIAAVDRKLKELSAISIIKASQVSPNLSSSKTIEVLTDEMLSRLSQFDKGFE